MPSEHELPPPESPGAESPEADALELILAVAQAFHELRAQHLAEFNLNEARFAVLQVVSAGSPEGCTQNALAERLQQSESNVSTLLERMRLDGLLTQTRSTADRRKCLVRLTPRGMELWVRVSPGHRIWAAGLLAGLSSEHQRVLSLVLSALLAAWKSRSQTSANAPSAHAAARPEARHAKAG